MGRFKDLLGIESGSLTVIAYVGKKIQPNGKSKSVWEAECVCGNRKHYTSDRLSTGRTKSCGCLNPPARLQHGLADTPTYNSWNCVVNRCTNPRCSGYPKYGAIGVTCNARWLEPNGKGFLNFLEDMGERPEGTTINRIGSVPMYSKETCEWATLSVQAYDQKISKKNTSGRVGVSWNSLRGVWEAYITYQKKRIGLGLFTEIVDAIAAREVAELKYYGKVRE